MQRIDAANAIQDAFEAGYEELFLAARRHVSGKEAQAICRAAFKYLIRRFLENDETALPSAGCLLHMARAFVQAHLERSVNNTKLSSHHNPTLSS